MTKIRLLDWFLYYFGAVLVLSFLQFMARGSFLFYLLYWIVRAGIWVLVAFVLVDLAKHWMRLIKEKINS